MEEVVLESNVFVMEDSGLQTATIQEKTRRFIAVIQGSWNLFFKGPTASGIMVLFGMTRMMAIFQSDSPWKVTTVLGFLL